MSLIRKASKLAAGIAAAGLLGAGAQAAEVTIRIGHLNPPGPFQSHSGAMTTVFKSLVETASGGAIEVKLFPNGQLGKDNEVIQPSATGS